MYSSQLRCFLVVYRAIGGQNESPSIAPEYFVSRQLAHELESDTREDVDDCAKEALDYGPSSTEDCIDDIGSAFLVAGADLTQACSSSTLHLCSACSSRLKDIASSSGPSRYEVHLNSDCITPFPRAAPSYVDVSVDATVPPEADPDSSHQSLLGSSSHSSSGYSSSSPDPTDKYCDDFTSISHASTLYADYTNLLQIPDDWGFRSHSLSNGSSLSSPSHREGGLEDFDSASRIVSVDADAANPLHTDLDLNFQSRSTSSSCLCGSSSSAGSTDHQSHLDDTAPASHVAASQIKPVDISQEDHNLGLQRCSVSSPHSSNSSYTFRPSHYDHNRSTNKHTSTDLVLNTCHPIRFYPNPTSPDTTSDDTLPAKLPYSTHWLSTDQMAAIEADIGEFSH